MKTCVNMTNFHSQQNAILSILDKCFISCLQCFFLIKNGEESYSLLSFFLFKYRKETDVQVQLQKCISSCEREKSIFPKTLCQGGSLTLTSIQYRSSARRSEADSWDGQVRADKSLKSGLTGFDKSRNRNLGEYV